MAGLQNCSGEVIVLLQGNEQHIKLFKQSILDEHPPLAIPVIASTEWINSQTMTYFIIKKSAVSEQAERHIPADYFTCDDCLAEMNNPDEHRYRYPFINCTQCCPRYTIIHDLPYDRPNTSMADFPLCPVCHKEYSDPLDRRFHAQPLACAQCEPKLSLISATENISGNEASLCIAVKALREGKIIAIKGVGGYHLICDATNEQAVQNLRTRKHRPDKPLAVMFSAPAHNELEQLKNYCSPNTVESSALSSPQKTHCINNSKKEPFGSSN